jgi:transposase-like protein
MCRFAEEEGLVLGTLSRWVHLYRRHLLEEGGQEQQPTSLVPVDVAGAVTAKGNECASLRLGNWLEAETPQGVKVRFCEGTRSAYVADLVVRLAGGGQC